MNYTEQYNTYLEAFNKALNAFGETMDFQPPVLGESMRYSLFSGGKRIRPVLFFAVLDAFGCDFRKEADLAVALECIHTYSLIHDDLPAMDNDDFRRGKPSNHKKFGEANAILAGDALLSYAFDVLLKACLRGEKHVRAAQRLSLAAGADGMIAGQSADLLYEGKAVGKEELFFVYAKKTGELLTAPVVMAAILAGKDVAWAERFGADLGALFQITDDILDVKGEDEKMGKTLGKDEAADKLTCVKVLGLQGAEALADEYAARCLNTLEGAKNAEFLIELVRRVRSRDR